MPFFIILLNFSDADGDDALNRTEFAHFLHPEDHAAMRDVVVLETLEDIDKDKVTPLTGKIKHPNTQIL